ncbi:MAG: BMP family ABC transporter substrate-binding protein [Clostridiales bacterium]|nr:BMP family ABC transporter substrate-binding protein [Clostridiales bacterium]
MKKVLALILALVMALALVACGNKTETPSTSDPEKIDYATVLADAAKAASCEATTNAGATGTYKVAMITDYGDITDQSFNQTTYEACKAFAEKNSLGFTYYKPAGDSTADRVAMVDKAVADGYNVIVMPGYAFAGTVTAVENTYPDVSFIALDVAAGDLLGAVLGDKYDYTPDNWDVSKILSSNVYCAVYQEELCGYMAGYAAVKLGYTKLGYLGGMAVPAVVRYGYGFVQGADAAAKETGATVTMKYAYGNQFFGDADITAAMDTWYAGGVELVFACGGGIYTSVAEAAKKANTKLIGVDVDQSGLINSTYKTKDMVVTSAMKGLASTVNTCLEKTCLKNDWASLSGKIENLGLVSGTDPLLNYVQIPMDTTLWDANFTQDNYKTLVADMFSGKVKVSNDISVKPADMAKNFSVEDLGNIK